MATAYQIKETGLARKSQADPEWTEQQTTLWWALRAAHLTVIELEHAEGQGVHLPHECMHNAWALYTQLDQEVARYFTSQQ